MNLSTSRKTKFHFRVRKSLLLGSILSKLSPFNTITLYKYFMKTCHNIIPKVTSLPPYLYNFSTSIPYALFTSLPLACIYALHMQRTSILRILWYTVSTLVATDRLIRPRCLHVMYMQITTIYQWSASTFFPLTYCYSERIHASLFFLGYFPTVGSEYYCFQDMSHTISYFICDTLCSTSLRLLQQ
jgi:hypothetical protein